VRRFLPHPRRFVKAITSSVLASAIDVATLLLLVKLSHLAAGIAAGIGCLVGGVANFTLSRSWVFDAPGRRGGALRQLAAYGLLVVVGGALLGGAIVQLSIGFGISLLAAKLVAATVTFAFWNYPIAGLVFHKEPAR
jgi:putative flippase GtrA